MSRSSRYDTPPKRHGATFTERYVHEEKDIDNELIAKAFYGPDQRVKTRHVILRCLTLRNPRPSLPAKPAVPQTRPFHWKIATHYYPEEYHAESLRRQAPWYLLVRVFAIDLPEQLENGLDRESWRDHQVKDCSGETQILTRNGNYGCRQLKWGRRIVFSERTEEQPNWLIGRWLVVAYLWSDNQEWLRSANVGNLASLRNTVCIRVYEKRPQYEHSPPSRPSSSLPPVFKRVCQLDRVSDSPEPRVTLFSCPPGFHFLYGRPISPETTVPQRLSRLSSLMNNEARGFLYGPSSQQLDLDTWHGNVRRPCCKDSPDADSRLALESSPDKPECGHCTCCQRRRDRPGTIESKVGL